MVGHRTTITNTIEKSLRIRERIREGIESIEVIQIEWISQ